MHPRGLERSGGAQPDAAAWRSTYSSVGLSMWNIGTSDGMNEKRLAPRALFLDDIEPINGELVVHHGKEFTVMANSPDFDEQLADRVYYFWSTLSPSVIWVDLAALADSAQLLALNPRLDGLIGDVTGNLASAELAY